MKLALVAVAVAAAGTANAGSSNLKVTVTCADYFVAPRDGLKLEVDGIEQPPAGIDWAGFVDGNGNPDGGVESDVGYQIPSGHHDLEVTTPDCAGSTTVDMHGAMPQFLTGSLAITNNRMRGTITAPNGFGFMLGGVYGFRGAHAGSATDGLVSMTISYRRVLFALDQRYGEEELATGGSGTSSALVARFGPRFAFHDVEVAAGLGVGGEFSPAGELLVPAWASVTYKPTCSWGVMATATYDVHPGMLDDSTPTFGLGVLWQPSRACSDPPHLAMFDPLKPPSDEGLAPEDGQP